MMTGQYQRLPTDEEALKALNPQTISNDPSGNQSWVRRTLQRLTSCECISFSLLMGLLFFIALFVLIIKGLTVLVEDARAPSPIAGTELSNSTTTEWDECPAAVVWSGLVHVLILLQACFLLIFKFSFSTRRTTDLLIRKSLRAYPVLLVVGFCILVLYGGHCSDSAPGTFAFTAWTEALVIVPSIIAYQIGMDEMRLDPKDDTIMLEELDSLYRTESSMDYLRIPAQVHIRLPTDNEIPQEQEVDTTHSESDLPGHSPVAIIAPACATEDMLDEEQWHLALNPQQPGAPSGAEQQQRSNANTSSKPGQPKPTKPSWFALIMEFLFLVAVCALIVKADIAFVKDAQTLVPVDGDEGTQLKDQFITWPLLTKFFHPYPILFMLGICIGIIYGGTCYQAAHNVFAFSAWTEVIVFLLSVVYVLFKACPT
ncbi:uncharacterized protein STEHIDRAFT_165015 [Stereum hirsutum FP-91666 SS1]|uniref:uncharacterized protein n=1 Tax=Stereum hirsutum (strain FP-91666) TaxID=721885 RepID=UPI000440B7C1|nr:uncharacterized protein STEHIDRAFT_165015 [Stereum hirsutum FP-91666 SS1]EIM92800.1 hypothetical protein STEHIDRAFT_165015 [Stereum hirsutum FP-91666 SS1]